MGHARRRVALVCALVTAIVGGAALTASSDAAGADTGVLGASDVRTALSAAAAHTHEASDFQNSIAGAAHVAAEADSPSAVTLPAGFADVKVIGNITEATAVDFAADGTAFVALKTGLIKSFDYAGGQFESNDTATNFADLSPTVNNYWDRGLTGITLDPRFGTAGHNYVYVNYTYNRDPRDNPPVVPKWGDPAQQYDVCPQEATTDPPFAGCAVMMRVTRLTATKNALGWEMVPNSELELLAGGCFQFGSHASGDVVFGPDGKLYASAGEGASFDTQDYGQYANPCGDPANEGGSLRSQDYRTGGDPLGVDGTIVRLDPAAALTPTQATANQWLVAYGQRNPWRLAVRPGTQELWSGDVGGSNWEEVNRIPDVNTVTTPINRGWPCYEGTFTGSEVQEGWDALDRPICENLYAQGTSAVSAPYFSYQTRGPKLTGDSEDCANSTSSVSGVSFGTTTSNYPAAYKGAMFFSDFARSCIWVLGKKSNGDPDPANIQRFVQAASTPVGLESGPGGDLYYVDYGLGADQGPAENAAGIHRIVYTGANATPTAKIASDKVSGPAPLTVQFDGTGSTDPDADTLTYAWDLDGDGAYNDSTAAKPSKTYAAGTYTVGLKVSDGHGHTATATSSIQSGNSAPVLGTVTPTAAQTWKVGDSIGFSATASDPQQGTLPSSAFSWTVAIRHCPTGNCHTHPLQSYPGVSAGSFTAPDHEYPSHLLLTVTVTDSGGLTDTRSIELDPKTVTLAFASSPTAATVTVNGADHATPYNETFIQGSRLTMTAAPTTGSGASTATFASWSDGLARSHEVSAPTAATTYTATYTAPGTVTNTAPTVNEMNLYPGPTYAVGQTLGFDAAATDPQQELPASAYSFVMERQACATGCPRQVLQRWAGVTLGQFKVPAMPYPSHLFLTATVTDANGATGSRTVQLDPRSVSLTVGSKKAKVKIAVDGVKQANGWSQQFVIGSSVSLVAPKRTVKNGVRYVFVRWIDGGDRKHAVTLGEQAVVVKAIYRKVR